MPNTMVTTPFFQLPTQTPEHPLGLRMSMHLEFRHFLPRLPPRPGPSCPPFLTCSVIAALLLVFLLCLCCSEAVSSVLEHGRCNATTLFRTSPHSRERPHRIPTHPQPLELPANICSFCFRHMASFRFLECFGHAFDPGLLCLLFPQVHGLPAHCFILFF